MGTNLWRFVGSWRFEASRFQGLGRGFRIKMGCLRAIGCRVGDFRVKFVSGI